MYVNCMDCPNHMVVRDPDPHDSFCDDDEAVLCKLTENTEGRVHYTKELGAFERRPVSVSIRPYNKRKECAAPSWCPLKTDNNKEA